MKITNLNFSYSSTQKATLKDICLDIKEGEITAIVGATGSGKTTLLNILNLSIKIKEIEYELSSKKISNLKRKELSKLKKELGTTYQLPEHQIFGLTVKEDIEYTLKFNKVPKDKIEKKLNEVINLLGIKKSILNESPFSTSEGEKRKVTLAGILMKEPEYIFLDEPTSNIDDYSINELIIKLKELNKMGKTIIFISHDMNVVARLANNLIVIDEGEIKYEGKAYKGLKNIHKYSSKLNKSELVEIAHKNKLSIEDVISEVGYE